MIIKGPTMTGENEHKTHSIVPAGLRLLFHPTDMCCAPTLFQKLFQGLERQQSRQTQSLPSWNRQSWRACRVHGADT